MSEDKEKLEEPASWGEILKVLIWVFVGWVAGASLLVMAAMAVMSGKIKNRAGPDSYDFYAEEPVEFIIQVVMMLVIGLPFFLGCGYVIVRVVRRKLSGEI